MSIFSRPVIKVDSYGSIHSCTPQIPKNINIETELMFPVNNVGSGVISFFNLCSSSRIFQKDIIFRDDLSMIADPLHPLAGTVLNDMMIY